MRMYLYASMRTQYCVCSYAPLRKKKKEKKKNNTTTKNVEKEQKSNLKRSKYVCVVQAPNVQNNRLTAINSGIITKMFVLTTVNFQ